MNNNPNFSSSRFLGSTGDAFSSIVDTQMILYNGPYGDYIWRGVDGDAYPVVITGAADPIQYAQVYSEGSQGYESNGEVIYPSVDFTTCDYGGSPCYSHIDGIESDNSIIAGDSGGPLLYPSIFGYLAGGTLVAADGPYLTLSQQIDAVTTVQSLEYGQTVEIATPAN